MPRTPIPDHLIHRPEDVERNAQHFDHLCALAEEVAFPVVREAVVRETSATGAEVLTNEAKLALEALAEDAAVLEGLDQQQIVDEVRRSLQAKIPPPSDEECHALTRDVAQVMTSAWLELLRGELTEGRLLALSNSLLPQVSPDPVRQSVERVDIVKPFSEPIQILSDSLASFPLNAMDIEKIMSTLRLKLFPEPILVALPFNLVLAGGPRQGVIGATLPTFREFVKELPQSPEKPQPLQKSYEPARVTSSQQAPVFVTRRAVVAVHALSKPLSLVHYASLVKMVR